MGGLASRFVRIRADRTAMGLPGWLFYLADRALSRISFGTIRVSGLWFYSQAVPATPEASSRTGNSIQVRVVAEAEFPETAFNRPVEAIRERFRDGSICVAAFKGDEMIGFMWLSLGPLRERLFRCVFEPAPPGLASWDYDIFIEPRYRLGRTFVRLWDEANQVLRERGVRATVSWVRFENLASQKAHQRLGARRVGWLVLLQLGGWQIGVGPQPPRIQLAGPRSTAHVRVDARIPEHG